MHLQAAADHSHEVVAAAVEEEGEVAQVVVAEVVGTMEAQVAQMEGWVTMEDHMGTCPKALHTI